MSIVLKKGSKGDLVKELQNKLGLKADGDFGPMTEKALIEFQKKNKLTADGIAGPKTLDLLQIKYTTTETKATKTSVKKSDNKTEKLSDGTLVNVYLLPSNEYRSDIKIKPEYIFLHHTAGWQNPYKVVDGWVGDKVGRVSTQYVIGGQSIKGNDNTQDGVIVKCMPDETYSGHLGAVNSRNMHVHSIGIEICSFGQLTYKNGKYLTYTGAEVEPSQVAKLNSPFKGYNYFHKYSKKQIDSTISLLKHLGEKYKINLKQGLLEYLQKENPNTAFSFKQEATDGKVKGILSHGNVRKDKIDVYPDPYLIQRLKEL